MGLSSTDRSLASTVAVNPLGDLKTQNRFGRARFAAARRWFVRAALALPFVLTATCTDRGPTGLGPNRTAFARRPMFARMADGGPTITLASVSGTLLGPNGEHFECEPANFVDGVATLTCRVTITGAVGDFTLTLNEFDASGALVFSATVPVTVHAGAETTVPVTEDDFHYSAPDATVSRITLAPPSLQLNSGETAQLTANGFDANNQPIALNHVGWTSADPSIEIGRAHV